jgi:hypothetical protein
MAATRAGTLIAVTALILALTACTSAPAPEPPRAADAPADHSPTPTPTSSSWGTGAALTADTSPCATAVPSLPVDDADEVEQLGGVTLAVPIDRGRMPHARGIATLDSRGTPVAYRVASDDNLESIGSRFCLAPAWLQWVNVVRRDSEDLYEGDTLNLDAHTILSVGDQNGRVGHNPLPDGFVIPPQKDSSR